jgi:hypothetical protein
MEKEFCKPEHAGSIIEERIWWLIQEICEGNEAVAKAAYAYLKDKSMRSLFYQALQPWNGNSTRYSDDLKELGLIISDGQFKKLCDTLDGKGFKNV